MALLKIPKTALAIDPYDIILDSNGNLGIFYNSAEIAYFKGGTVTPVNVNDQQLGLHSIGAYNGENMSATTKQVKSPTIKEGVLRGFLNRLRR